VKFLNRIGRGAQVFISGVRQTASNPDVKTAYGWLVLALFLVSVALNLLGIWAVWHFTPMNAVDSIWLKVGYWLLRIVATSLVLLLSPLISITFCNLVFPAFSEIPFLAGVRALNPKRAEEWETKPGLPLSTSIAISSRRLAIMMGVLIGCFLLALVPVVGPFIATPLQFYLGARTTGWEMLDPYFDRQGLGWEEQGRRVGEFLPEVLGMGLVCAPVLAVPFLGPLCFGLLQAGAAKFVLDILDKQDSHAPPSELAPRPIIAS